MKKNMISIIIMALLVVNIAMTAIMMFSVIPANKKSIALVDQVASAIKLDTAGTSPEGAVNGNSRGVSLADTATATIEEQQTFQLKKGEDGDDHYVVCTVAILMDSTAEDYATYGADILESRQSLILNALSETIGQYTYEDVQALGQSGLQDACLERLQELFGSTFIYQVAFSGYIVQ
ncbi:MAG: flagellar basal body-associated FliL family protein [Lachnospiraceae bacterium]|nr:flagellar basal body-associated FliL family protein [Lachnospiraceae bacterium]